MAEEMTPPLMQPGGRPPATVPCSAHRVCSMSISPTGCTTAPTWFAGRRGPHRRSSSGPLPHCQASPPWPAAGPGPGTRVSTARVRRGSARLWPSASETTGLLCATRLLPSDCLTMGPLRPPNPTLDPESASPRQWRHPGDGGATALVQPPEGLRLPQVRKTSRFFDQSAGNPDGHSMIYHSSGAVRRKQGPEPEVDSVPSTY